MAYVQSVFGAAPQPRPDPPAGGVELYDEDVEPAAVSRPERRREIGRSRSSRHIDVALAVGRDVADLLEVGPSDVGGEHHLVRVPSGFLGYVITSRVP